MYIFILRKYTFVITARLNKFVYNRYLEIEPIPGIISIKIIDLMTY